MPIGERMVKTLDFQDYYKTLGIAKTATQKEVQAAYRKLARKMHPDVNKEPDAEKKFKAINEAYEVLKDPEKRKQYDQLGANWRQGENYSPPPEWGTGGFNFGDQEGFDFSGSGGQFSDFFETLFGRGRRQKTGPQGAGTGGFVMKGSDQEGDIELTLEDVYFGGSRTFQHQGREIKVNIKAGTVEGSRLRLTGQGSPGIGGGPPGDLYLRILIRPHPVFQINGNDLSADIVLTPWEAALGGRVEMKTMDGPVNLTIPPGVQPGQRLRLKGKGMPRREGGKGDLYAVVKVAVPSKLTDREKELMEELGRISTFNPRQA